MASNMESNEIDHDNLEMLKELLADKFDELIRTYLNDSNARIEKLKQAFSDGDLTELGHQAHGLKGSSRNIGANPLADICGVLESQAQADELVDGQQQVAAIEQKLAVVAAQLKEML